MFERAKRSAAFFERMNNRKNPYLTAAANEARDDLRNRLPTKYAQQAVQVLSDAGDTFPNHNALTLAAALAYADVGLSVIDSHALDTSGKGTGPSGQVKIPRGTKWQTRASVDPAAITSFWTGDGDYLADKNGGVYPFAPSHAYRNVSVTFPDDCGLFVMDIDGDDGKAALEKLESEHGDLPKTWESITGSGGYHLIFRANGTDIRNTASSIAPGVDIRGTNGQIIAPPSIHPNSNFYRWDDGCAPWECDVADAPEWLVKLSFEATKGRGETDKAKTKKKGESKARKSGASARQGDVVGFDDHLGTIGDGDGQQGFDSPIYSAACSYFSAHGVDADGDELFDILRATIATAEMKSDRFNKDRYLSDDDYLTGRIEQAREFIAAQDTSQPTDTDKFEDPADWLPARFKIRRDTVYIKGGDDEPDMPICHRFEVVGRSSNLAGDAGAGRIISFVNENGETVGVTLDRAELFRADGGDTIKTLADKGMGLFISNAKTRENFLALFRQISPQRQIPTIATPGWTRDRMGRITGFMLPTGKHINATTETQNMRLHDKAAITDRDTAGTLDGSQIAADAAIASPNFYWTLGLCAGFVGPVQTLIGAPSCGMNLSGDSSLGKTIALTLAAMSWGNPHTQKGVLNGMNSTQNAIEDLAVRSSGTFLGLDEIGQMQRLQELAAVLFNLGSGSSKNRKSGNGLGLVENVEFQIFALLSNEHSLKVAIEGAGGKYKTGLSVRFPDVDITGGKRVSADVLTKLNKATDNFGHMGPAFVQHLIDAGWVDRAEELKKCVADTADEIAGKNAAPATRRAAQVFALARVAGELAVDAGLIKSKKKIATAVAKAFKRFKGSDEGQITTGSNSMLDGLRSYITRNLNQTIVPAHEAGDPHHRGVIGWYTADTIILDKQAVSDVSKMGLNGKIAGLLDALDKKGALIKSGKNRYHNALPDTVEFDGVASLSRVPNYRISRAKLGV